ncbi:ImcF-related family protein [Cupriavidus sp. SZY C1]|uniref:ImcF-related family protein n=1 Tax=Cupriavidus sp. SZY C1 TaxID=3055037 RepID=UPI0028BCF830|nr:ImcF-related family protein [Cupriavidus sp. SZY C1]MDT6962816.1 ImcF-related family protein [Cupriavidus sp. SZY C1]
MTIPSNNVDVLTSATAALPRSRIAVVWGWPLAAAAIAAFAAGLAWFAGDMVGLPTVEGRITALIWIGAVLIIAVALHVFALLLGAYGAAKRMFSHETGEKPAERPDRDARLQNLCDALRVQWGWRWRYRLPWLLVCGDDAQIDAVAPNLKQAAVLQVADMILVHPSPDGIDAKAWRQQLRRLRRRCPIDAVVQVVDEHQDARAATERLRALSTIEADLGWAAPVSFLHAVEVNGERPEQVEVLAVFAPDAGRCTSGATQETFGDALRTLESGLAFAGVQRCVAPRRMSYLARVSHYVSAKRALILESWEALYISKWRRAPLSGVVFAPLFPALVRPMPVPTEPAATTQAGGWFRPQEASSAAVYPDMAQAHAMTFLGAWQAIGANARHHRGRRVGIHASTVVAMLALTAMGLWTTAMLLAAVQNHHDLRTARQAVQALHTARTNPETRLQALDTLQQHIQRYEHRLQNSAPLFTRFGMNRDAEALAALWKPYAAASHAVLVTPVVQDMEATLVDLSQLQVQGLTDETSRWALDGRDTLKAYLMLAHPERVEPDFLAQQLARHWSTEARIPPGRKQDLAERLARFYADHLQAHPDWRVTPRAELVAGARQTLLAVIGERNAVDTIYQTILEGAGRKYPDLTLAALAAGTDTRGLVRATGAVPGVFTRQGYEGYVEAAIEKATRSQDVAHDWVLTDGQAEAAQSSPQPSTSADALRDALAQRYFADYAEHWQQFMNGLQWEPATTLPGVVDQLKLLADARQSPVIALMKSLAYQGGAGARKDSLSDTLVAKAQGILGRKDEAPETVRPDPAGPLGAAFGPVLRLAGQPSTGNTGGSELSLQRYLDRVTAVRLRLQQMTQSADANALARQMAQSLFQGKGSDLADTQAYARLMAASLGAEWAGMGETLFVRPVVQAEQSVLQPAQASLNEAWRRSIALPWQRAFAGRYPFAATANDASLPELARYIRPQSGLINTFLLAELAGVLALQGDQWVPVGSGTGLTFDPAFLKSINTLQRIGAHLLVQGEPRYQFELRPIPTPGLTDTRLTLDRQTLHYYNQRETWQAMSWPAANLQEPRTLLQWQTERAGTNKTLEIEGVWAWVRMLEQARVTPIDSATVQLTFHARPDTGDSSPGMAKPSPEPPDSAASLLPRAERVAAPATLVHPIHYQMRTAVGRGPLEALELRDLRLPERIFVDRAAPTSPARAFYPISM